MVNYYIIKIQFLRLIRTAILLLCAIAHGKYIFTKNTLYFSEENKFIVFKMRFLNFKHNEMIDSSKKRWQLDSTLTTLS